MPRAWEYIEKQWVTYPATRWTIEWCAAPDDGSHINDAGDLDPDALVFEYRSYGAKGKGLAVARAKQVIAEGLPYWGLVQLYQERFEPEIPGGNTGTWTKDPDTEIELDATEIKIDP